MCVCVCEMQWRYKFLNCPCYLDGHSRLFYAREDVLRHYFLKSVIVFLSLDLEKEGNHALLITLFLSLNF